MSDAPAKNWRHIWDARALDPSKGSTLAQLMAADGLDTGFGDMTEAAWRAFVARTAAELKLRDGSDVFEVGCGAGAFLYELDALGHHVGGLDQSAALIDCARNAIPRGRFHVADAAALDAVGQAEAIVSWGVFLYFPTLTYASAVLERMAAHATRVVGVFDLPDQALKEDALVFRRGTLGAEAYEERYRGLDHLYFDREWVRSELQRCGLRDVKIESQQIPGYANGAFRFNAIGFKPL